MLQFHPASRGWRWSWWQQVDGLGRIWWFRLVAKQRHYSEGVRPSEQWWWWWLWGECEHYTYIHKKRATVFFFLGEKGPPFWRWRPCRWWRPWRPSSAWISSPAPGSAGRGARPAYNTHPQLPLPPSSRQRCCTRPTPKDWLFLYAVIVTKTLPRSTLPCVAVSVTEDPRFESRHGAWMICVRQGHGYQRGLRLKQNLTTWFSKIEERPPECVTEGYSLAVDPEWAVAGQTEVEKKRKG